MTIALIDADPMVYAVGFATQKNLYDAHIWDAEGNIVATHTFETREDAKQFSQTAPSKGGLVWPGDGYRVSGPVAYAVAEPVENALYLLKEQVEKVKHATKARVAQIYVTGEGNFRASLGTIRKYKGNRDVLHKPVHYAALRAYAKQILRATVVDGMEADDAISIEATKNPDTIICSVDKDLNQIPGWHYNPKKDVLYLVSEQEARHNFWMQVLTGDPTDNVAGVPGIGPKTAAKILDGCKSDADYFKRVGDSYGRAFDENNLAFNGLGPKEALEENCRLLYLLRSEGDMWAPPTL